MFTTPRQLVTCNTHIPTSNVKVTRRVKRFKHIIGQHNYVTKYTNQGITEEDASKTATSFARVYFTYTNPLVIYHKHATARTYQSEDLVTKTVNDERKSRAYFVKS